MNDNLKQEFITISHLINDKKYSQAEKVYLDLIEKNSENMWLKDGLWKLYIIMWEEDKAKEYNVESKEQNDDEKIINIFREIEDLIFLWKNDDVKKKYEKLLKKYPDHIWIKEWYDKFLETIK